MNMLTQPTATGAAASVKAAIIKESRDPYSFARLPDERVEIEAADEPALFKLFFQEHVQRYRYVNSVSYRFEDPEIAAAYRAWLTPANYAAAGGDMW